jgi:periplasmic divalent cation tolerance protein
MSKYSIIITTTPSKKDAKKLAKLLLSKKLCACIQIEKIYSLYRWNETIEKDKEFRLFIKTKDSLFEEIKSIIKENHPYDIPQIIEVPITNGNKEYFDWVDGEIG